MKSRSVSDLRNSGGLHRALSMRSGIESSSTCAELQPLLTFLKEFIFVNCNSPTLLHLDADGLHEVTAKSRKYQSDPWRDQQGRWWHQTSIYACSGNDERCRFSRLFREPGYWLPGICLFYHTLLKSFLLLFFHKQECELPARPLAPNKVIHQEEEIQPREQYVYIH